MYQAYLTDYFLRQLKPHIKKFRNLEKDLIESLQVFSPETSDYLGHKLYKIRLKSSDVPKGKSKSFRMIVFVLEIKKVLTPINIYFKSDRKDISEKEIEGHLENVLIEIRKRKSLSK